MKQRHLFPELLPDKISKEGNYPPKCRYHNYYPIPVSQFIILKNKKGNERTVCVYCEQNRINVKKIVYTDWKKESDELSDYYIKKKLCTGKDGIKIKPDIIPSELIEATRAVIKIKRLVKKSKEPLKKCSFHGNLYKEDVIKAGIFRSGAQAYRCRKCMKEQHAKHYQINKAKVLLYQKKYKKENPQRVKEIKQKHFKKNQEKYRELSRQRFGNWEKRNPEKAAARDKIYKKGIISDLHDVYVREQLTRESGLKGTDIPEALIQLKRASMMLKRGMKKQINQSKLLSLKEKLNA